MTGFKRLVRGAGLGIAGILSLTLGLLLAERLVRFDVIGQIDTTVLSGLVLLFVLPVLTYFAIRHDGRVATRAQALAAPSDTAEPSADTTRAFSSAPEAGRPGEPVRVRVVRHEAHEREPTPVEHRHAPMTQIKADGRA